jgi:hypothetical protein
MIFDRFCGLVERHLPELRPYASAAKIFSFDAAPHEFLPADYPEEERQFISESFFLPFRTVAVEDAAGLIILHDPEPDIRGLGIPRMFIEVTTLKQPSSTYDRKANSLVGLDQIDTDTIRNEMIALDPNMAEVHWGYVSLALAPKGVTQASGHVEEAWMLSERRVFNHGQRGRDDHLVDWEMLRRSALANAKVAIMEIVMANQPSRFVVEVSPVKKKAQKKTVKIPRSDDRPIYILAEPKEIRRRMRLPEPDGSGRSPRPHERRAHVRIYRDPRYVNLQGQTRVIPATWVGPSESIVGKRRYKVMLDI